MRKQRSKRRRGKQRQSAMTQSSPKTCGGSRRASQLLSMADLSDDVKNKLNALQTKLGQDSQELIRVAMSELNLSARTYDRILKVSRTIADLDQKAEIAPEHVSEAIQYRTFDRTLWV